MLKEMEKLRIDNKELAKQLSDIIDVNVQLRESNQLLQEKCEVLLEELSVKEAKWTEREEKLQAEVSQCQQNDNGYLIKNCFLRFEDNGVKDITSGSRKLRRRWRNCRK